MQQHSQPQILSPKPTDTITGLELVHFSPKSKLGRLLSIYPILEPKSKLGRYFERFSFQKQLNQDVAAAVHVELEMKENSTKSKSCTIDPKVPKRNQRRGLRAPLCQKNAVPYEKTDFRAKIRIFWAQKKEHFWFLTMF